MTVESHRLAAVPDASALLTPRALQQLWFALQRRPWSSLVVIPVEPGRSARFIAQALVQVAELHRGVSVKLVDAAGAALSQSARLVSTMTAQVTGGGLAICLVDSVLENQAGIPLALAADALLLATHLGVTRVESVRRTVELVGKERLLGSVTIRPPGR